MDKLVLSINENWKFHYGECEEAFYKGWDDSNFIPVILPHDWSVTMPFERTNSSGTGYLSGGVGWYRLHFNLPDEYRGKHIVLHFDGIYKNSQVWINSYNLGKHPNGYTPISYDISKFACFGEVENVVAVKVIHNDLADSRWFTGSGITRTASVIVEELVHPKEDGTYLYTKSANESEASFMVHHEAINGCDGNVEFEIEATLFDEEKQPVWVASRNVVMAAHEEQLVEFDGEIKSPKLWDVDCPKLYTLRIAYSMDGESYICEEVVAGLREATFDADKGFFLNHKELKLKGVCVHHDAGVLGAAVTKEVWKRRLLKLKECGCNAIRCSHNPHMPALYELCDELGFVMMDEAFDEWECPKNKWSTGHNVYPPKHQGYAEDFPEWHERDLKSMVRRDRIHPSVIMWSIGNEIDYPNDPYCHPSFETMTGNNDANKPKTERMYDPNKPDATRMIEIAKELSKIVKTEDTSRPVTMALAFPELSTKLGIFKSLEVAGYNYKEQFYADDHNAFPETPILGSENGHGYEQWCVVRDNKYISGQFLWTGIDYLGEAKGWPIHGAQPGLLTLAGFEKHRFAARKSYWLDTPVLSIATRIADELDNEWKPCERSWNYKAGDDVLVKVFSNLPEVALYVNGKEVAKASGYNGDGVYQFVVPFEPGEVKAVSGSLEDSLCTTKSASDFKCTVWEESDEVGYLYQLEIELKDVDGNKVVWDDVMINVKVTGDGILKGIESGDVSDNSSYALNCRKTFMGNAICYIRRTGVGKIGVEISAEDMVKRSITLGK